MATPAGIEPALSDVTDRCFDQLNYGAKLVNSNRRPRTTDLSRYHHIDNLVSTVNSDFQQDGNQPHLCFLHYLTSGFIARMCPYYLNINLYIKH